MVETDDAARVDGEFVDLPAVAGHCFGGGGDAGVFDGGNDEAAGCSVSGIGQAEEGEVVGFGAAAGEEELVGRVGSQQAGDFFAGFFEDLVRRRPAACWLAGLA